jgi:mRNA-degrading endonuclease RelE of RelBE toxin-antitoxin system
MNKIDKYIRKLLPKERQSLLGILEQIRDGDMSGLDIKKLKGYDNYFRVRKGKTRIIFHLDINDQPVVERVERRSDTTY